MIYCNLCKYLEKYKQYKKIFQTKMRFALCIINNFSINYSIEII